MRKLIRKAVLSLLIAGAFVGTARADLTPEARAYKIGLEKGIEAGLNFCTQYTKQELLSVSDLIDSALNYKYLFLKGEIPPPVVVDKTEVEQGADGVAYLIRKLEVLPPAYFPVDRIEALREKLLGKVITIPKGYITYVDVSNVSLPKVAEWYYLAQTDGFTPVFVPSKNLLILSMSKRKADCLGAKAEAERIGIPSVKVAEVKSDMEIAVPQEGIGIARMIKTLSQRIAQKEERLIGVENDLDREGLSGVLYYLRKAEALTDTINTNRYSDLNVGRLRGDINAIINQLLLYLSQKQPYRKIFIPASEVSSAPSQKPEGNGKGLVPVKDNSLQEVAKEIEELKQQLDSGGGK